MKFQRGFSLIELMIAMVLSLVLLAGTLVVFSSGKAAYINIDQLSKVQENGRYALDQILRDIRSAGYSGCVKSTTRTPSISTLNSATAMPWAFDQPLGGFNGVSTSVWSPALDSSLSTYNPTPLNDVIVIRMPKQGVMAGRVTSPMLGGANPITIAAVTPDPVAAGDIAMISNCTSSHIFQVSAYATGGGFGTIAHGTGGSPGNASNTLSVSYGPDAEVVPLVTNVYFVGPASTVGNGDSLWRKPSSGAVEEIIEGASALQVLYGIDTDDDQQADNYVVASAVTDWNAVISVRVALLVQSLDQYGADIDTKLYTVLDTTAGPFNDRRLRQLFTTTATLRNKTR